MRSKSKLAALIACVTNIAVASGVAGAAVLGVCDARADEPESRSLQNLEGALASSLDCDFLSAWQAVKNTKPAHFEKITDFNRYIDGYRFAQEQGVEAFYAAYRAETVPGTRLFECLPDEAERLEFETIVPRVFLNASIKELKEKASGEFSRRFVERVESKKAAGELNAFRLIAHHDQSNPTGKAGGFHRANRSIFMDLGLIPGSQWLLVLTHELAHSVDSDLAAALPRYNDEAKVARISDWARRDTRAAPLTAMELAAVDEWLLAGLNRELLTEVRAWALTIAVYSEGLRSGLFGRIDWVDAVFAEGTDMGPASSDDRWASTRTEKKGAAPYEAETAPADAVLATEQATLARVLGILSPRFVDPTEGVFSLSMVRQRLKSVRRRLLDGKIAIRGVLAQAAASQSQ